MAINYITVNTNKLLGTELRNVVEHFKLHQDKLKQLKDNMDNMTDASDWTKIELEFGLPAGKGQTVYNLVAGSVSELPADTNLQQLIDWIIAA